LSFSMSKASKKGRVLSFVAQSMEDPLGEQFLPPELRSYLFGFFTGEELCTLSLVASHWAHICRDDIVWVQYWLGSHDKTIRTQFPL